VAPGHLYFPFWTQLGDIEGPRHRVEGTLQKLYVKWYGIEPDFRFGDAGLIRPRVAEIGKSDDPWHDLPAGFLDKLLGDKSYELDQ
jgi:hypothetical protein